MSVSKKVVALAAMALLVIIVVTCDRTITRVEEVNNTSVLPAENCFTCHSDQNTFLVAAVAQWQNSVHASGRNADRGASTSCAGCHISEGFIQRAAGETVTGEDDPTPIHCFTCHAPHSNGDFRFRWTAKATLLNGDSFDLGEANTCVACHQSRGNVDTYISASETFTSTHWGPHHSVQGDMLIGSNGYEYDDYDYGQTKHSSGTENGCLDCHFEVRNTSFMGGHSFNMEHDGVDNTAACAQCHADMEEAEDFNRKFAGVSGIQDSVITLVGTLQTLLENTGLIGIDPEEGHLLPIEDRKTSADSAGAVWNWLMAEEDRSHGVHNPQYILDLLNSSIQFLQGTPSRNSVTEGARSLDEHAALRRGRK